MERFFQFEQWITGAEKAAKRAMAESPLEDQELMRQLSKGKETAFTVRPGQARDGNDFRRPDRQ